VSTDVLSGVLRAVRLTGSVYFDFEPSAPWVAEAPPSREIAATVMPGAERVIEYHLIARGACWGQVVDQQPIRLNEGDFIVFPQGDAHILSSAPGMRATLLSNPSKALVYLSVPFVKVPFLRSLNACCNSSAVFITMGPYHATGSSMGRHETSRNRMPSSPACTTTSSPRSNSTSERFSLSCGTDRAVAPSICSVTTPCGCDASRNVPDPAKTYANA
jgi:quercetin dioxygenase-like cupin family protein